MAALIISSIDAFAGISTSEPLSHNDLTNPPPAPTAVIKAAPLPTLPPERGPAIVPSTAPAPAPIAISLAYSVVTSNFVPPIRVPELSSVFTTAEIGIF